MIVSELRRMTEPLLRLVRVEEVGHQPVFDAFADGVAKRIVAERVRAEPRVASLAERLAR